MDYSKLGYYEATSRHLGVSTGRVWKAGNGLLSQLLRDLGGLQCLSQDIMSIILASRGWGVHGLPGEWASLWDMWLLTLIPNLMNNLSFWNTKVALIIVMELYTVVVAEALSGGHLLLFLQFWKWIGTRSFPAFVISAVWLTDACGWGWEVHPDQLALAKPLATASLQSCNSTQETFFQL